MSALTKRLRALCAHCAEAFQGISLRLVGAVVIPLVLLSGVSLFGMDRLTSQLDAAFARELALRETGASIQEASNAVKRDMAALLTRTQDFVQIHQRGFMTRQTKLAPKVTDARAEVRRSIDRLGADFAELMALLEGMGITAKGFTGETATSEDPRVLAAGHLAILRRQLKMMPYYFDFLTESNERTLRAVRDGRFEIAVDRFVFEEASRLDAMNETLSRSQQVLTSLDADLEAFQMRAAEQTIASSRESARTTTRITYVVLAVAALALIGGAAAYGMSALSRPLQRMAGAMNGLAQGDTNIVLPANARHEIGEMARAVAIFRDNQVRMRELDAEKAAEQARREERTQRIEASIATFETEVERTIEAVASAAGDLRESAQTVSSTAEDTSTRSSRVASASEQATSNVTTVASAAEEMAQSIGEIGARASESAEIASKAVEEANDTMASMEALSGTVQHIDTVLNLISDIAEQTNLLALNATIEAARAGEAGKGFAVVANEVKSLANQTEEATQDIARQISNVQGETRKAVAAMRHISGTINRMNEIASAIASAVEEQSATTHEIARNTQEAAAGNQEVTDNITSVSDRAQESGQAAQRVLSAVNGLQTQCTTLREEVDRFLSGVRAA